MLARALVAFLVLPGVVAFAAPLWLASRVASSFHWSGFVLLIPGTVLLVWCAREFLVRGQGTLAPWEPPRHLVVSGLYRYSRNPMYVAVLLVLAGWALGFRSPTLAVYAVAVGVAFHWRVRLAEEPFLARTHRDDWARYRRQVPRWVFRSRRGVLLFWAGVGVALPMAGLVFEAYADARDATAFPPPGTLVDVGGRRLHLLCIGDGGPTVFFEASGWGSALSSARARESLARRTRVCSYDRAGKGWSDAAPGLETPGSMANDLGVLQDRSQLAGPYVIVASSIGGLTAEMFARRYPERVAGLVFVDAASSLLLPRLADHAGALTAAACGMQALASVGILRLLDPFQLGRDSDEARLNAALLYNSRATGHLCAMARGLSEAADEFAAAPPLPRDVPLVALSASSTVDLVPPPLESWVDVAAIHSAKQRSHQQLAMQSARGSWHLVPDSTHLIGESQPEAVADVVSAVIESAGETRR